MHKEARTLHMNCRPATNIGLRQEKKSRDQVPAEVVTTKSVSSSTAANVIKPHAEVFFCILDSINFVHFTLLLKLALC